LENKGTSWPAVFSKTQQSSQLRGEEYGNRGPGQTGRNQGRDRLILDVEG